MDGIKTAIKQVKTVKFQPIVAKFNQVLTTIHYHDITGMMDGIKPPSISNIQQRCLK